VEMLIVLPYRVEKIPTLLLKLEINVNPAVVVICRMVEKFTFVNTTMVEADTEDMIILLPSILEKTVRGAFKVDTNRLDVFMVLPKMEEPSSVETPNVLVVRREPDAVENDTRLSTRVLALRVEKKLEVTDTLETVALDTFMVLAKRVDADKVDTMVVDTLTNGTVTVENTDETIIMVLPRRVVVFHWFDARVLTNSVEMFVLVPNRLEPVKTEVLSVEIRALLINILV